MKPLRVGTRGSNLATTQTRMISQSLTSLDPDLIITEVIIKTEGDGTNTPLSQTKNPGVFVTALRDALMNHEVDYIVHSMKDLPAKAFSGITLVAIPSREDARDAFISNSHGLAQIASGSLVGTSSPRRAAAILKLRPDLRVESIRGNVETRIRKVREGQFDATVLALAGLKRLGLEHEVTEILPMTDFLPAPSQGALAIECRSDDDATLALLQKLDDEKLRLEVTSERSVLLGLNAGCSTAIGAYAITEADSFTLKVELGVETTGEFVSLTKTIAISELNLESAHALGMELATDLLSHPISGRAVFS